MFWFPSAVASILVGLGSPSYAVREHATWTAAVHYPATEPVLRMADRSNDPEVKERAVQARRMGRWGLGVKPK